MVGLAVKKDFPVFNQTFHGHPLVYLDSGASAQKPRCVITSMTHLYETDYANIHRGVYELSMRVSELYEDGRRRVQKFLNAAHEDEIVFTSGATEAINLVAASWGRTFLKAGDEIVLTQLEHHANIVPWQLLREQIGFTIRVVPIQPNGDVLLDDVVAAMNEKTKLVSVAHVSNALGTILPVEGIIAAAHVRGIPVLLDGSQAVSHRRVDVQKLDADFYVFSGHKIYGPTGIGVLYGKRAILKTMPPYQGGGDMIESVTFEKTTYQEPPMRFEAGTPPIAEVVGLHAALDYVDGIGMDAIAAHEADLLAYGTEKLSALEGVSLIGTAPHKAGILSFVVKGVHPHDVGTVLDNQGIAIRAGHHCAQPAMDALGLAATVRASLALYNTREDIDALVAGIKKVQELFK
ncbi:MAG TPA: cysteine desulfurase CsdA [Rhodospirillaceae bacterium]|nr:cysteine desulfurase CsdA [Rhodospirillaceae bacterium]